MKSIFTIIFFTATFLSAAITIHAQDSSGAKKHIEASSEKADNLHGKKIQQQSLSSGKFEKLDTSVITKPVAKKKRKTKRKPC